MFTIKQKDNKFTITATDNRGEEVKEAITIDQDENPSDHWDLGQLLAELSKFREKLY